MRAPWPGLIAGDGLVCAPAFPRSATAATTPFDFAAARTSVSVTRPSGPVPFTLARSTPSSAATRRATGDALTRASSVRAGGFFFFLSRRGLFRFFFGLFFLFFRFLFFFFFWSFLAFAADKRDFIANVHLPAFFDVNFGERSVLGRFPFHRRFVGFDFSNDFAGRNFVAFFLFPRDERPLGHV